ncbi:MAG: LysR substrate-binding domain-containing protein [Bradyrhizobium sp.]
MPVNLDIDVLRTLVVAHDLGAFNRAAKTIGRSQSAVSQQVSKLEDRLGLELFRKEGRGLIPTEAGEIVLGYARRIIDLNDEAVAILKSSDVNGSVRLGFPSDFADHWLPTALGRFKRSHPKVRIEATVDRNVVLADRLEKGQLDLIMLLTETTRFEVETLADLPMAWIGPANSVRGPAEPVPLAVLEAPCTFRAAAIAALDRAEIPWHIAFTTPSLSGLWAAVDAGLGITVRTAASVPDHLTVLGESAGLPALPMAHLFLSSAGRELSPAAARFREILTETLPVLLSLN